MKREVLAIVFAAAALAAGCNNGLMSGEPGSEKKAKVDRSKKTAVDSAEYVDFTVKKHNARSAKKEEMTQALNGAQYKNGNSSITIKQREGVIELSSDSGYFNGKNGIQVYAVFSYDIQAASEDCLYIRKDQKKPGFLMVDGYVYKDDAMPDLAVCLPLYGYSKNRIEVSSVMDGFIVMPSGTYWRR